MFVAHIIDHEQNGEKFVELPETITTEMEAFEYLLGYDPQNRVLNGDIWGDEGPPANAYLYEVKSKANLMPMLERWQTIKQNKVKRMQILA